MNEKEFNLIDLVSAAVVLVAILGAVFAFCNITAAGIALGAIGLVSAVAVKVLGSKFGLNPRLVNMAFIIGIVCAAMVLLDGVLAAIIDYIFESAQI